MTEDLGSVLGTVNDIENYALRYHYNQFYIEKANTHKIEIDRGVLLKLIKLDIEMTGYIDEVMAQSYTHLQTVDNGKLLDEI